MENGTAENFDVAKITKFCTTKNVLWFESGMMNHSISRLTFFDKVPTR